jgi:hypothetical protein
MQTGKVKVYFCSRRDGECCLSTVGTIHCEAGIFYSHFVNFWDLSLHGHRRVRVTAHLIRRTGVLSLTVSLPSRLITNNMHSQHPERFI